MSVFSENLKKLRKEINFTQEELAKALNVTKSRINMYERGEREPKFEMLENIADYFNVDMNFLLGKTNVRNSSAIINQSSINKNIIPINESKLHRIPILGTISAGLPLYAEQHIEGYTYTELNGGAEYFGLKIKGDSMNALRICDGDIIIVKRQDAVENGDIAVVLVDKENATVKQFFQEGSKITLVPRSTNPEHTPQFYDLKDTQINVLGKVVRNQIDF